MIDSEIQEEIDKLEGWILDLRQRRKKLINQLGEYVVVSLQTMQRSWNGGSIRAGHVRVHCNAPHIPGWRVFYPPPHSHMVIYNDPRVAKKFIDYITEEEMKSSHYRGDREYTVIRKEDLESYVEDHRR